MSTVGGVLTTAQMPRSSGPAVRAPRRPRAITLTRFLTILAAHGVLALIFRSAPALGALHALAAIATALWLACSRRPDRAFYGVCYIAGAEVLWRMTHAPIFWETGKYAVTLVLGVYLARVGLRTRYSLWPFLYLGLLLPGVFVTLQELGFSGASRDALSFNLSGPISLGVCLAAFASADLRKIRLSRLMMSLLWPIGGIATLAAYSTLTASAIEFSTESNFTTSGGYGPNQVSAILSIGALAGVLLALIDTRRRTALVSYGLAAALLFQAVLTFSRGGVFAVVICLAVLLAHYFWRPDIGLSYLVAVVLITVIGGVWLMPRINTWTGGALAERYASLDTTHRSEIASEDVELFFDHPIAGVGVGMAKLKRKNARYLGIAPHTEFSRVLAEHGSFGVLALLALALMTAVRYVSAPTFLAKGWVCSLTVWCLATMSVSAMRLSVLGVLFGIAYLPWSQLAPAKKEKR